MLAFMRIYLLKFYVIFEINNDTPIVFPYAHALSKIREIKNIQLSFEYIIS
jgi:hypothetical protein